MAMERTEKAVRSDEDEWTNSEGEQPEMQVGFVEVVEDENFLRDDSKKSKKEGPAWKINEDTEGDIAELPKVVEKKSGTYAAKRSATKAPPKMELFPTLSDSVQQADKQSEKSIQKSSERIEHKETSNIFNALEDEGAKEEDEEPAKAKQAATPQKKEKKGKKKWAKQDAKISLAVTAGQKEGGMFEKSKEIIITTSENISRPERKDENFKFTRNQDLVNTDIGRGSKPIFGFKRDSERKAPESPFGGYKRGEERKAPETSFGGGPIQRNQGQVRSTENPSSAFGSSSRRETENTNSSFGGPRRVENTGGGFVRNPIEEKPKDTLFSSGPPRKFVNSKKHEGSKNEEEKKEEPKPTPIKPADGKKEDVWGDNVGPKKRENFWKKE